MEICELKASDLEDLLDLYQDLHDEEQPSSLEDAEKSWQEAQDNPRIRYFGAFVEGELVSSCTITIIPNLTRGCRPYGLIENVVTREALRRKGLGKAILQHAIEYAWAQNCYKVMLMTGRLDEKTFAFYESAGFDSQAKQAFVTKCGK